VLNSFCVNQSNRRQIDDQTQKIASLRREDSPFEGLSLTLRLASESPDADNAVPLAAPAPPRSQSGKATILWGGEGVSWSTRHILGFLGYENDFLRSSKMGKSKFSKISQLEELTLRGESLEPSLNERSTLFLLAPARVNFSPIYGPHSERSNQLRRSLAALRTDLPLTNSAPSHAKRVQIRFTGMRPNFRKYP
jgi:hypothetical protein